MNKQSGEHGSETARGAHVARADADAQHHQAAQNADEGGLRGDEGRIAGSARQMMSDTVSTTEHVASGLVGGVATVASDLVHGVGDIGSEVVSVVRDTANTAITGVGSVGATAVHTLTDLLVGVVGGVREIGSAAMRGRPSAPEEHFADTRPMDTRVREERTKQPEEVVH